EKYKRSSVCRAIEHRATLAVIKRKVESPKKRFILEGRIHHARGCAVAACHLAKLLRPHRHRCGDADGLDVRGDHLERRGAGARVVGEWGAWSIDHTKRRAFLRRAPGGRDSQCALAGALE